MANTKLILILITLLVVVLASGCVEKETSSTSDTDSQDGGIAVCPESCDDGADYTRDYCSAGTNYKCEHELIPNICGNQVCEQDVGENTFICPQDCQRKTCIDDMQCDDNNPCTKDTCTQAFCYNVLRDAPCRTGENVEGTAGKGIELIEAKICTDEDDKDHLIGTIKNKDVDIFGAITVNAMLYTYGRGSFVGEKTVNAYANVLGPEQESWFKIPLATYGEGVVKEYEINLDYLKTAKPATDLEIINFEYDPHPETGQKTKHPDGYYYFTGDVKNYAEGAVKNLMVYNADNCITPITPGKTTLLQSMSASFWDKTLTPANLTAYGEPV